VLGAAGQCLTIYHRQRPVSGVRCCCQCASTGVRGLFGVDMRVRLLPAWSTKYIRGRGECGRVGASIVRNGRGCWSTVTGWPRAVGMRDVGRSRCERGSGRRRGEMAIIRMGECVRMAMDQSLGRRPIHASIGLASPPQTLVFFLPATLKGDAFSHAAHFTGCPQRQ
jgi:hypothetical protein